MLVAVHLSVTGLTSNASAQGAIEGGQRVLWRCHHPRSVHAIVCSEAEVKDEGLGL